jgi:hypothetical protein
MSDRPPHTRPGGRAAPVRLPNRRLGRRHPQQVLRRFLAAKKIRYALLLTCGYGRADDGA